MVNKQCDGQSQSPIDITKSVSLNENLKKIELASSWDTSSLQTSTKFKLENKGYTVQLDIHDSVKITSTQSGKTFDEQSLTTQQNNVPIMNLLVPGGSRSVHILKKTLPGKLHLLQRCSQIPVIYLGWFFL